MNNLFRYSLFNGDISKWEVSSVTSMNSMFRKCVYFNSDISDWNVFNVTDMSYMFTFTYHFDKNISNWNLENVMDCTSMFRYANAFEIKYNNGKPIPEDTGEIKSWLKDNRERMNDLDIKVKHGDEIDNFFANVNINLKNNLKSSIST